MLVSLSFDSPPLSLPTPKLDQDMLAFMLCLLAMLKKELSLSLFDSENLSLSLSLSLKDAEFQSRRERESVLIFYTAQSPLA
jgi:hypothetical protein